MTKAEARKVEKQIESEGYQVTSCRYYGPGSYSLVVVDHVTGYTIVIGSAQDWAARCKEA